HGVGPVGSVRRLLHLEELAQGRLVAVELSDLRHGDHPTGPRPVGPSHLAACSGPWTSHHRSSRCPRTGPGRSTSSRTPTTWSSAPPPPSLAGPPRARRSSRA